MKTEEYNEILDEIKRSVDLVRAELSEIEAKINMLRSVDPEPATVVIEKTIKVPVPTPAAAAPAPAPAAEKPAPITEKPAPAPAAEKPAPKEAKPEVEELKTRVAVVDAMLKNEAWRTDMPSSEVADIKSALALNDRILFINSLFEGDAELFGQTISRLNCMTDLDEAVNYLKDGFRTWDWGGDLVYRFMMIVRRKIR